MVEKIVISGKRKRAIARAVIQSGKGEILIDGKEYKSFHLIDRLRIEEPLRIAKNILGKTDFDINVKVKGGGRGGQIEAARLAIAKSIVKFSKSLQLKKAFENYDWSLLIADTRRKEPYKPGDSKARRKRQKSYR